VPAIARTGQDKSGNPVSNLPEATTLLPAAFASDIGVDNEALRTRAGGYVWFEIAGIEPEREKSFDEVREDVLRQWRENEIAQRLTEKARQLVERLDKGETIEAIATEVTVPAKTVTDLARRAAKDDLSADAVNRVFSTAVGKAGSAPNGADSRAVFKVTAATVPPLVTTTQEAQRLEEQLRDSTSDDVVGQFIANAQKDVNVVVYQDTIRQIVGGDV
jgi:peptidyl-prolyl cis-trans isomerase D